MERSYRGRDMLRDFTIQPATGGSPAGKAYTHQFPKHVFLYLGMFFIEHVLFLHYEARCWLLIGHEPFRFRAADVAQMHELLLQLLF